MEWAEPRNFKEWATRVFSFQPLMLILLILLIFVSELRFDWIERVLGAYLVTTNSYRPESGAIWEISHKMQAAQQMLEQIVTDRQSIQREARGSESFSQIAVNILPGQGVMLSADHFRQLYLKLPPTIGREITSPFDLLKIYSSGKWVRTYFKKSSDGLEIYLLDNENRVLQNLKLTLDLLDLIETDSLEVEGPLETLPNFKDRIYPADRFFAALESLPPEIRRNIVSHPEKLLGMPGGILRVGISDEAVAGFIELGFEVEDAEQPRIVLTQGLEWAVWQLRSQLEEKPLSSGPIIKNPSDGM